MQPQLPLKAQGPVHQEPRKRLRSITLILGNVRLYVVRHPTPSLVDIQSHDQQFVVVQVFIFRSSATSVKNIVTLVMVSIVPFTASEPTSALSPWFTPAIDIFSNLSATRRQFY